ncbi:MAG: hypothetical protein PVF85_14410 [Anaerolineales bacterium]|jgi:hypothetical protein
MFIGACTRTTVPFLPEGPEDKLPTEPPPAATLLGEFEQADYYSVVWVPEDASLKIHNPAGIAGTVIGELAYDQSGIRLTGGTTSLGSSQWVEIETQGGITGWVNEWNLTETVRMDPFCADGRIPGVLVQIIRAVEAQDGQMLADYVNPERGLIIRYDWWNPEVIIPYEQVPRLFEDRTQRDWGVISGGEFHIVGSFDELIRPLILETVENAEPKCDELPTGTTTRPAVWPGEYTTLHYRAFYRPAPQNGNPFNWRTWAFAFEYIGGRPYLTVMVQFHGDI